MIGGTDPNDGTTLTDAVTAIQTALATLQRLGRSDEADTLINDAEQSSTYAALDADTTHNDTWKLQRYAQTYTNVMASLAKRLSATADLASTKYKIDAETVFGTRGLPGDPGFLIVSLRDAQDRIEGEYDTIKLQRLLDKAVLNGDDIRSHAIVEAAVESGDSDTVEAFQNAYPALAEATARLWNVATHGTTTVDVVTRWRVGALKPGPLGSLQDHEIQAAAAGQTSVGSWNVR
jgi:hypothetical protein